MNRNSIINEVAKATGKEPAQISTITDTVINVITKEINCEMRAMLRPLIEKKPPKKIHHNTDTILMQHCADAFGVSINEIKGKNRSKEVVFARHMYAAIRRAKYGIHPRVIGAELGKDRTTALNSIQKGYDLIETDKKFKAKYLDIMNSINP